MEAQIPRIGVAIILKDKHGRILFMKRKGSKGAGTWAIPGGHLEYGETLTQCVIRETKEELGIDLLPGTFEYTKFIEDIFQDRHYITFYFEVPKTHKYPVPKILEPNRCEELKYFFLDEVPKPVFDVTQNWIDSLRVYADDIE